MDKLAQSVFGTNVACEPNDVFGLRRRAAAALSCIISDKAIPNEVIGNSKPMSTSEREKPVSPIALFPLLVGVRFAVVIAVARRSRLCKVHAQK